MRKKLVTSPVFPVVGIGGSAGGLEAFRELLQSLSGRLGMAYIFVMHLSPKSKSALRELLASETRMPVCEAKNGMPLEADHVYVISPNTNISISGRKLLVGVRQGPDEKPVDILFRSLAQEKENRSIGVVMSGTATDGTLGAEAIKAAGGITFAQDESAKYDGMPHSAIAAGCIDFVLSPKKIAAELERIAAHPLLSSVHRVGASMSLASENKGLEGIFAIMRSAKGLDFSGYKSPTVNRRISRRMVLLKIKSLRAYAGFLRLHRDEIDRLYEDLLLKVTCFFRDPKVFDVLRRRVLPEVLRNIKKNQAVRVWVPGCSTGEEAYSIAICVAEALGQRFGEIPIRIFATDVSDGAIEKARRGIYGAHIKSDIAPHLLRRFFIKVGDSYKVSKVLRDMCVFSRQNVFDDPPFSNIDLVSCRNLLIYLQPVLQKKVFRRLHYALRPGGFLLLGGSESASACSDIFRPVDRKNEIFVKRSALILPDLGHDRKHDLAIGLAAKAKAAAAKAGELDIERVVEQVLLKECAPCGALVDSDMEVVLFRGRTGRYLESASGKPSLNILKLAKDGLSLPLREALYKAKKTRRTVRRQVEGIKGSGRRTGIAITVIPVKPEAFKEGLFLVLFSDSIVAHAPECLPKSHSKASMKAVSMRNDEYCASLQKELSETKQYLQTVIEEHESAIEETKTASEEILSSNEELQSTNEELETAKEELQSSNEELITANEELQSRNTEFSRLNNDMINLLSSINMPVLMLDTGLVIRRVTSQTEKLLNISQADIGRPIQKIKLNLDIPDLEQKLIEVIESLRSRTFEIADGESGWYSVYMKPYRTSDNKIDGVVMIFVDVTDRKKAEVVIDKLAVEQKTIFNSVPAMIWYKDGKNNLLRVNQAAAHMMNKPIAELEGKSCYELFPDEASHYYRDDMEVIISGKSKLGIIEQMQTGPHDKRWVQTDKVPYRDERGNIIGVIVISIDITDRKKAEDSLRQTYEQLKKTQQRLVQSEKMAAIGRFSANIAHEVKNPMSIMLGGLEFLEAKLPHDDQDTVKTMTIVKGALLRANSTLESLLHYAQPADLRLETIDISEIVELALDMVKRRAGVTNITIDTKFTQGLKVRVDKNQLHQALLNIVINSMDAMPDGGRILIETNKVLVSELSGERLSCVIEVTDTGTGITRENMGKLAEPFFSTKVRGVGTGLGLFVTKMIVENHKGKLFIESGSPKGAVVKIALPLADR